MKPTLDALVVAARRTDDRVDDVTRERMRRRLLATIACSAGVGLAAASSSYFGAKGGTAWLLIGKWVAGAALATGLAVVVAPRVWSSTASTTAFQQHHQQGQQGSPDVEPPLVTALAPEASVAPVAPSLSAAPQAPAAVPEGANRPRERVPQVLPSEDAGLSAEEVALLRNAHAALASGDFGLALALADEHAARFPRALLGRERRVIRALALCASGRRSEGLAEAAPIVEGTPNTPTAARLKAACR